MRNNNLARQKRKKQDGDEEPENRKEEKVSIVSLSQRPELEIFEVFDDDDQTMTAVREFMTNNTKFPTKEQVMAAGKKHGLTFKFKDCAGICKTFLQKLLDSQVGLDVEMEDKRRNKYL